MTPSGRDYSWLPEHQGHVAYTLGHVDALIERAGEVLHDYNERGPFDFGQVLDGDVVQVKVKAVAPLPAAVARYSADAMTQLRAVIEHTIFAEVEYLLGRTLTYEEAQAVEMPAKVGEEKFANWLNHGRRRALPPLHEGEPMVRRLRLLQPYQRTDADNHPMRVLAEHTNLAKHRTPAVAAVRLGAFKLDTPDPDVTVMDGGPIQVGDVLATMPFGKKVAASVWPDVSIQHDGDPPSDRRDARRQPVAAGSGHHGRSRRFPQRAFRGLREVGVPALGVADSGGDCPAGPH